MVSWRVFEGFFGFSAEDRTIFYDMNNYIQFKGALTIQHSLFMPKTSSYSCKKSHSHMNTSSLSSTSMKNNTHTKKIIPQENVHSAWHEQVNKKKVPSRVESLCCVGPYPMKIFFRFVFINDECFEVDCGHLFFSLFFFTNQNNNSNNNNIDDGSSECQNLLCGESCVSFVKSHG